MPAVKACPDCGVEFVPTGRNQKYCSKAHAQRAADRKYAPKRPLTKTDRVIAVKGRRCSNCRYDGKGRRNAFWWDDDDRIEEAMETAMVLCSKCFPKFNRQLATERKRVRSWELKAEAPIYTIPF